MERCRPLQQPCLDGPGRVARILVRALEAFGQLRRTLDTLPAARRGALPKSDAAREGPADAPSASALITNHASDDSPDEAHGRVDVAAQPSDDAPAGPGYDT